MDTGGVRQEQRREGRRCRNDGVAKATGHLVSAAVASRFGQGEPAGCEDNRPRANLPSGCREEILAGCGGHFQHSVIAHHLASAAGELVQQRIEHISRSIAVREQLAASLLVQRNADVAEKCHCLGDRERPEDLVRMMEGRPPLKSASLTTELVTLHRDPPLTRIFAPGRRAPSRSASRTPGCC